VLPVYFLRLSCMRSILDVSISGVCMCSRAYGSALYRPTVSSQNQVACVIVQAVDPLLKHLVGSQEMFNQNFQWRVLVHMSVLVRVRVCVYVCLSVPAPVQAYVHPFARASG
jgi:hypothetical protein